MPLAPAPRSLVAAIALVTLAAAAFAQTPATGSEPATQPTTRFTTASGLTIVEQGMNDLAAQPGDTVVCHYTGKLTDGKVFDSSRTRGEPFTFRLGIDGVIKGWAEGVTGMRTGQKRLLIIPPELGYGAAGAPPTIPANATLTFEIEVLSVTRPAAAPGAELAN
jgi:peptidylprolyl isomerase